MVTTTQITTVETTVSDDYFGGFVEDFDLPAVDEDYREALEKAARKITPSVTIAANGMVFAELADADAAADIDWRELAESIDVASIVERHER